MAKQYFVLKGSKAVYPSGHYNIEAARAVAKHVRENSPRVRIYIVSIEEEY